jgi:hypothetical protein
MSKEKKLQIRNSTAEFLVFTRQAGEKGIEVRVEDETVWLTQKLIAVLFGVTVPTVNEHLKNLFSDGEIQEDSVVRKFRTTAADAKQYLTAFYNLDAIIAVGFRVNSARAIQFRQWATGILRDFAIRGYVLDKERLKNGAFLSREYYENLLAEIREIRASERKFYQKITDIYATAMDYHAEAETTQREGNPFGSPHRNCEKLQLMSEIKPYPQPLSVEQTEKTEKGGCNCSQPAAYCLQVCGV